MRTMRRIWHAIDEAMDGDYNVIVGSVSGLILVVLIIVLAIIGDTT